MNHSIRKAINLSVAESFQKSARREAEIAARRADDAPHSRRSSAPARSGAAPTPSRDTRRTEMTVSYEWDVEHVTHDEYEDVQEHQHVESYAEAVRFAATPEEGCFTRIVLVRDDDDRRSWAYLSGGVLLDHFEDAYGRAVARVPKRFHAEVARAAREN